ncbi:MAG: hypothetical protein WAW27_01865 [Chitinophagaceae bacterium]
MKKIILPLLFLGAVIYSCGNKDKKADPVADNKDTPIDSSLITDSSWGLITKKTKMADLQAIYGVANVKDERICGPECADSIDVTRIYPEKNNEFIVYWKDSLYHTSIAFIETYSTGGSYHTASGLKIGSTLEELLKVNGKQIIFAGFDWDYGGYIQDYGMGTLQNSPVGFRLEMTGDGGSELSGDSEFTTEMPEVKRNLEKIKISTITLSFSKGQ